MTRKQKKTAIRIACAALLLATAFLLRRLIFENAPIWCEFLLYLPAYLLSGYDVLRRAVLHLARGQLLDENFLMAIATAGAIVIGFLPEGEPEFAEAVFVMVFYQTGELFQSIAVGKSRRSIAALMNIRPDVARVWRDGAEAEVSPEEVTVGETILIRPGEKIPLDGVVFEGISDLDTAALTGESAPRAVSAGDAVISGCTNLSGLLRVKVTKVYGESTVSRVLRLVEDSAARKSKSERFITRFARYYTPAVVGAALLLAFLPPLFLGDFSLFPHWLARALTFLVISCPCALVISVPLSFFGGIGGASREGILIKGSNYLEALARTEIAVFDKTGTLTRGKFAVTDILPRSGEKSELLALAAAAEQYSRHPIALALREAAATASLPLPLLSDVRESAGRGVTAVLNGARVAVGNGKLMASLGISCPETKETETVVYVAKNGTYLGCIRITDSVKENAAEAVADLSRCGVRRVILLTGDREAVAERTAKTLGISEWHADLLPADKVREVEAFFALPRRGTIAFSGDGVNDAPVLARADVGIAMGALGSDAAIEAADVVLMDDDPLKIAAAIRLARRTLRIVRENVALALSVKFFVLIGCALGIFGRWQMPLAVFADVGVAVLAILNAMRAMRMKK